MTPNCFCEDFNKHHWEGNVYNIPMAIICTTNVKKLFNSWFSSELKKKNCVLYIWVNNDS